MVGIWLGVVGLCFGGTLASYPSVVMDIYGSKYYPKNYAIIFLAYGIGGLSANPVFGYSIKQTGTYFMGFWMMGVACVIGLILSLIFNRMVNNSKAKSAKENVNLEGE